MTLRTGNDHIRQELDVKVDFPRAIAERAAQAPRIIGKVPCFKALCLCLRQAAVDFAQFIMDIGVRCHRRADIDSYGRCVDEFNPVNA